MKIEECYEMMGGSYTEVSGRLPSLRLVEKFIGKFLEDGSYQSLCDAMEAGNRAEAFRAAHTLKGVSANLSLGRLQSAVGTLTELLRPEGDAIPGEAAGLMEEVGAAYQVTAAAIRAYLDQN